MANRHAEPGEGQLALFTEGGLAVQHELEQHATSPELGAAVGIEERAKRLGEALRLLNQANMRQGLQAATATDGHPEIADRYGRATRAVVRGAAQRQDDLTTKAKWEFALASGMPALLAAGVPEVEAKALTRQAWEDFTQQYGVGVTNAATRNKKAKQLGKVAATIRNSSSTSL